MFVRASHRPIGFNVIDYAKVRKLHAKCISPPNIEGLLGIGKRSNLIGRQGESSRFLSAWRIDNLRSTNFITLKCAEEEWISDPIAIQIVFGSFPKYLIYPSDAACTSTRKQRDRETGYCRNGRCLTSLAKAFARVTTVKCYRIIVTFH